MSISKRGENEKISACVICGSEIDNIERCLKSLVWADEIIVVDSFSTDGTYNAALRYTEKVFRHEWLGYIKQKQLAAEKAAGPWIFFVDADEEVSDGLRAEIEKRFSRALPEKLHGFNCPRLVPYLGKWIRHGDWYPDRKLRLYKKDFGVCGGREPHDRISVSGKVANLRHPLNHYTYNNIADQFKTIDNFSRISAETNYSEGRRAGFAELFWRPMFRFIKGYIFKLGFLDGTPGFIVAVTTSFSTFAKYAKLWEMERNLCEKAAEKTERTND